MIVSESRLPNTTTAIPHSPSKNPLPHSPSSAVPTDTFVPQSPSTDHHAPSQPSDLKKQSEPLIGADRHQTDKIHSSENSELAAPSDLPTDTESSEVERNCNHADSQSTAPTFIFQENFYQPLSPDTSVSSSHPHPEAAPIPEALQTATAADCNSQIKTANSSSSVSYPEAKKADPAPETPLSQAEEKALAEEKEQQEKLRIQAIYDRMEVEKILSESKRQAIWADLQTELQRIWREVMIRRKKAEDDYMKNWQKVFLSVG
ncbi:MAG: hypothetical protein ACI38Q_05200 [Candidatus Bruticola sp.]